MSNNAQSSMFAARFIHTKWVSDNPWGLLTEWLTGVIRNNNSITRYRQPCLRVATHELQIHVICSIHPQIPHCSMCYRSE
jgi:hypothetical protein